MKYVAVHQPNTLIGTAVHSAHATVSQSYSRNTIHKILCKYRSRALVYFHIRMWRNGIPVSLIMSWLSVLETTEISWEQSVHRMVKIIMDTLLMIEVRVELSD